ncbi:hypothetical protein FHG87_002698 [Trinorchestia longiramus]|nr:hypothetical protein FHG87_002698 [Trinorchestia longiramus]
MLEFMYVVANTIRAREMAAYLLADHGIESLTLASSDCSRGVSESWIGPDEVLLNDCGLSWVVLKHVLQRRPLLTVLEFYQVASDDNTLLYTPAQLLYLHPGDGRLLSSVAAEQIPVEVPDEDPARLQTPGFLEALRAGVDCLLTPTCSDATQLSSDPPVLPPATADNSRRSHDPMSFIGSALKHAPDDALTALNRTGEQQSSYFRELFSGDSGAISTLTNLSDEVKHDHFEEKISLTGESEHLEMEKFLFNGAHKKSLSSETNDGLHDREKNDK